MTKTIKLTESDLERIIERVISEQEDTGRALREKEVGLRGKTFTTTNPNNRAPHGVFRIKNVTHTLDDVNKTPEDLVIVAEGADGDTKGQTLDIYIMCSGRFRIMRSKPSGLNRLQISPKLIEWTKTQWCPARGNQSGKTDF